MTDWRRSRVSPDGTHHLDPDGSPMYPQRYREVLKYHPPGLAPALGDDGAMHIDQCGQPAYSRRFARTFGFYEGRAAVDTGDGWAHILPDGTPLYTERYRWCGNHQGGRVPVRRQDGRYVYLDLHGEVCGAVWRYAGDHRDGVAVVQRDDGLHTHIRDDGALLHGQWFIDLDVFHKGFARARDDAGWMHIRRSGEPLYRRRFVMVEPFYNGQARVERDDGGLEVIDEAGVTVQELRPARISEFAQLSGDLVGFWRTDTIAAAVGAGVFESMPGTTAEIALRCRLQFGRLKVLLHGLRELQLVKNTDNTWALTPRGELLTTAHRLTLADAALEYACPLRALWSRLPEALQDPDWDPPDVFGELATDPVRVRTHHRMLRSYARHDYATVPAALRLEGNEQVLDIGGGIGTLAEGILNHYPDVEVLLLDRPEVLAQVNSRSRLRSVAADLFGAWEINADAAILARVLHDWDDEQAITILRSARSVLQPGARVYIIELLLIADGAFGGLCDVHLLMATGGRERTGEEYAELLEAAGFRLEEVRTLAALPSILVGVAK